MALFTRVKLIPNKEDDRSYRAFTSSLDTRKFEIELYWKRATYFWAFIAASFAGYFVVLSSDSSQHKNIILYVINCMGIIFSWTWILVLKGSKYWQENWERHVSLKEDEQQGNVFNKIIFLPKDDRGIIKAYPFSVSKLNILLSIIVLTIWLILFIYPSNKDVIKKLAFYLGLLNFLQNYKTFIFYGVMTTFTLLAIAVIFFFGRSTFHKDVVSIESNSEKKLFYNLTTKEYTN